VNIKKALSFSLRCFCVETHQRATDKEHLKDDNNSDGQRKLNGEKTSLPLGRGQVPWWWRPL
jgi:hypothetical protein